jgi:hypothetical protein
MAGETWLDDLPLDVDGEESDLESDKTEPHSQRKRRERYLQFHSPTKLKKWSQRRHSRKEMSVSARSQLDDILELVEVDQDKPDDHTIIPVDPQPSCSASLLTLPKNQLENSCDNAVIDQSVDYHVDNAEQHSSNQSEDSFTGVSNNDLSDESEHSDASYLSFLSGMDNDDDVLSDAQGLSEKVFGGCPISCQTSIVLVMSLISHHKLTKRAAQDLIQLLLCHFPRDHRSYTSLCTLKRRFASLIGKTSKGRQVSYCAYCHSLLNGQDSCTTCTNDENTSVGE